VADTIGERLLKEFGSIKNIVNADKESLMKVKGIGEKTANEIIGLCN
jgi:Fanconi anemia group M protein